MMVSWYNVMSMCTCTCNVYNVAQISTSDLFCLHNRGFYVVQWDSTCTITKYHSLCCGITTLIPCLLVMPIHAVYLETVYTFFSDFIIGFEQNVTRVSESQSILLLEVCVRVLNLADTVEFPEGFEVSLAANTIRGTAAGELIV